MTIRNMWNSFGTRVGTGPAGRWLRVPLCLATAVSLLAILVAAPPASAARPPDAMTEVKTVVAQALPILANKQMPMAERRRQLRELIAGHFDFSDMARSSLGYHWRGLTPAQRTEFVNLFTAFIEYAYLSKIQDYSGEQIKVISEQPEGPGYAQVHSQIVKQGKEPISVDYLLRQEGDDWKIYDVTVDEISIIANYRNQFNRVINNQGFETLVNDMRAKQEQLQASLESRS